MPRVPSKSVVSAAAKAETLAAQWRRERRQWREERRERLGYAVPVDEDDLLVASRSEVDAEPELEAPTRLAAADRRAAILELWDGGLRSQVEIARRVGVTSGRVNQILGEERPGQRPRKVRH